MQVNTVRIVAKMSFQLLPTKRDFSQMAQSGAKNQVEQSSYYSRRMPFKFDLVNHNGIITPHASAQWRALLACGT